jgi:hypothetical protein
MFFRGLREQTNKVNSSQPLFLLRGYVQIPKTHLNSFIRQLGNVIHVMEDGRIVNWAKRLLPKIEPSTRAKLQST